MSTIADEWIREGEQKGLLPLWTEAKLNQADQAQLETWADRILDAPTLADMFDEG